MASPWREFWILLGAGGLGVLSGGCREVVVDDWGPPAGYAVVEGTVRTAGGAPAVGRVLSVARCEDPQSNSAQAVTDGAGAFRAELALPPVGLIPAHDVAALEVRCEILVDRASELIAQVTLRYAVDRARVVPAVVDLTLP